MSQFLYILFRIVSISLGDKFSGKNALSSTIPTFSFVSSFKLLELNSFISPSIFIMFSMDFINEVFPAPFSPIKPITFPLSIDRFISPRVKLS